MYNRAIPGKIKGGAIRVPQSMLVGVDLTLQVKDTVDEKTINKFILDSTKKEMKGVIGYEELPLVSSDFNTTEESCIFKLDQTRVVGDHLVRVMAWYDNEWAFSCRMADIASVMGKMK